MHFLAPSARNDLDAIWDYIFEQSGYAELADGLLDSVVERFSLLAAYPAMGRRRDDDLGPGTRTFVIGNYVIIYRIKDNDVLILRVAHGKRDLQALLER